MENLLEGIGLSWNLLTTRNVVWTCAICFIIMLILTLKREKKRLVGYVSELRTHPIKSCRAIKLEEVEVNQLGVAHDRQYALFNEHNTYMNLSRYPSFAHIQPRLHADCILVDAPGMEPLTLPLRMMQKDGDFCSDVKILQVTMPGAVHVSNEADEWFCRYFGLRSWV